MHGIDSDQSTRQAKCAEQALHGRDLIGFVVAVEMREHQRRIGSKGAEHMRGAAVQEVVEAAPQGLAVDCDWR